MVSILALWLPILLSAVAVFIASSLVHMVLRWHRTDYGGLSDEDGTMAALRRLSLAPGDYLFPKPAGPASMKEPGFLAKWKAGPVGRLTILKTGDAPTMGRPLTLWFLYCVVVSLVAAYIAGRALAPGAPSLAVFRFAGATAFIAYGLGSWPESIWMGRPVSTTIKHNIDGVIYALVTGGIFGWLWPS